MVSAYKVNSKCCIEVMSFFVVLGILFSPRSAQASKYTSHAASQRQPSSRHAPPEDPAVPPPYEHYQQYEMFAGFEEKGFEEPAPMDENERIALQEEEDERIAREMLEREESEVCWLRGWREGGMEGGRDGGREEVREGGMEGGREGGREEAREGGDGGREGQLTVSFSFTTETKKRTGRSGKRLTMQYLFIRKK